MQIAKKLTDPLTAEVFRVLLSLLKMVKLQMILGIALLSVAVVFSKSSKKHSEVPH